MIMPSHKLYTTTIFPLTNPDFNKAITFFTNSKLLQEQAHVIQCVVKPTLKQGLKIPNIELVTHPGQIRPPAEYLKNLPTYPIFYPSSSRLLLNPTKLQTELEWFFRGLTN